MERIENLRKLALETNVLTEEFHYKFYKSFEQNTSDVLEEKYAKAYLDAMTSVATVIADGELIVGRSANALSEAERKEWDEHYKASADAMHKLCGLGQDSHMSVNYDKLMEKGICGIISDIDALSKTCTAEKRPFYFVCKKVLEAVVEHSNRYSDYALNLSEAENDETRKAELIKISEICRNVPLNPPKTFYEAVQSAHFLTYCLTLEPFRACSQVFQFGRPDRFLLPFYENDIKSGILTKNQAQLLLDCFGIQMNMLVPSGLSCGYMVGGTDENGELVENELTYMLMDVIDDIRLVYPAVGLCHTKKTSDSVLKRACELIAKGYSHPAIFNDEVIINGLNLYGVPDCDAHNYIHSACVEITPTGFSNAWVATPYTNMAQILLDLMNREYKDFDELLNAFFKRLDELIGGNFETSLKDRKSRFDNSMKPLLSCFVDDCLKEGVDIDKGGARYNWTMPSFVGIGNLVDSLYVIKKVIFEAKELTILELKAILDNNFEGNEALRLKLLNGIPKYGNDIDDVDLYYGQITEHIFEECKKYKGFLKNSDLIPSAFCWQMHEFFGRATIATPDGRKQSFPLGDGSGPCQGREMNGPTASILSSVKWDHKKFIGGVAVNIKFSKKSLGKASVENMKNVIKTYLGGGGFEIQVNVTDRQTLENAIKNPEAYQDLVVRIGGYSDYFVRLSSNMQQEVILRTEHEI